MTLFNYCEENCPTLKTFKIHIIDDRVIIISNSIELIDKIRHMISYYQLRKVRYGRGERSFRLVIPLSSLKEIVKQIRRVRSSNDFIEENLDKILWQITNTTGLEYVVTDNQLVLYSKNLIDPAIKDVFKKHGLSFSKNGKLKVRWESKAYKNFLRALEDYLNEYYTPEEVYV